MSKKFVLILQNEIMEYRKPVYNGLSKHYDVLVLHSGRPSVKRTDIYREYITKKLTFLQFHLQSRKSINKIIRSADVVISMFDLGWLAYLEPLIWKKRPKYILWGHRYSSNTIARVVRDNLMKRADRLLLYGDEEVKRMIARGLDSKKITIAWNTIEVPNHQDYSSSYKTSLLFVGRLQERKRIDLFIETFARLQGYVGGEVVLDIVGDGEIEDDLRRIAQNLRMSHKVYFHGRIDDPDALANIFSRAYAYVSPGPVGLGVLHSLAYGVPVITMREAKHGPEFHNLVHEHNALICESEIELELAMQKICTDAALARQLGVNSYQHYSRERTLSRMIDGFIKAIED